MSKHIPSTLSKLKNQLTSNPQHALVKHNTLTCGAKVQHAET